MKLTIIERGPTGLVTLGVTVGLLIFTACGSGTDGKVAGNGGNANSASDSQGNSVAVVNANPTTSPASTTGNPSQAGETQKQVTQDNKNRQAASFPSPQIGTGGNDFLLFTQARAALVSDAELKTANITIDVQAGVLTLNGTIANAAQKTKAEQLVRAVSGIKSVKNQLRISNRQST